ncbi:hypothetical protein JOC55_005032 [Paenibacillus sacheonensis]|nr:hypothetical protein [Paenibacillus sacheonensis]
MQALLHWIGQHWLPVSVVCLALIAIAFVTNKRKSLFYKE